MLNMFHAKLALPRMVRRLVRSRRGVTAIITAIALSALLGFAGLAMDVSDWLYTTRNIQSTADQAAYSAAMVAGTSGCASTTAEPHARAIAAARGYVNDSDGAEVDVTCNAGNATFTVAVSQLLPTWFSRLFLSEPPRATASATAQLAATVSDLCVLALDGTDIYEGIIGSDASAFWLNGNTNVNLHCGVAVDSANMAALSTGGSSRLTATDIYLVGDYQGSPGGSSTIGTSPTPDKILTYQISVADPYAGRAVPRYNCSSYGMTQLDSGVLDTAVKSVYCGGLTLGGSAPSSITVRPGIYIIAGGSLTFNSKAAVTGDGVTFVLTGDSSHGYATITINGGPQNSVSLTAPTGGPTGGLVFFQDRNAPSGGSASSSSSCGSGTSQNQINGGSNQLITGAIYFPKQSVCFGGGSSTTGAGKCTQLIAHTLSFTGNSEIQSYCDGTGISPITVLTPRLIR